MQVKKVIYIGILFFAVSCGNSEEQAPVDFDTFVGGNTGVENGDSLNADTTVFTDTIARIGKLFANVQEEYDTLTLSAFHPMDRFNFSSQKKMRFKGKNQVPYGKSTQVYPTADFFYYSFADTNKTINAFYNYLDGLAEEGEGSPIKVGEDVASLKTPPLFMFVYDTIIVSGKYMCEHEANNWTSFENAVAKVYGKNFRYHIDVDCGGPLKWK